MPKTDFSSVDEYIASQPGAVQSDPDGGQWHVPLPESVKVWPATGMNSQS
jgi:hypothetical protein